MKSIRQVLNEKKLLRVVLVFLTQMLFYTAVAQDEKNEYRNEKAYIDDFGKNELYIKESLAEYHKSIFSSLSEERKAITLTKIVNKLEKINSVLINHDEGLKGDVTLKNAFVNLNSKTVELLKNRILILEDYAEMSNKSLAELDFIFSEKEKAITEYYKIISDFEKTKRQFGLKYKVLIRAYMKKNIFEYFTIENYSYYKVGVIEEKFIKLINENKKEEAMVCFNYLNKMSDEILIKIEQNKADIVDLSLNEINKKYIECIRTSNTLMNAYFTQYIDSNKELQLAKKNENLSIEAYNSIVKNFNEKKNTFFKNFPTIQNKKQEMVYEYNSIKSKFLLNNIELENNYKTYATGFDQMK